VKLLDLADAALRAAKAAGADSADALVIERRGFDVSLREGIIEKFENSEGLELGLRVFTGKSSAMVASANLTPDALARLADRAVAMARLAPEDDLAGLAEPGQLAGDTQDLDLAAENLPDATALRRMAEVAEEEARAVKGVTKSGGAGASASTRTIALATSNGFSKGYARTSVSCSVSAIAESGSGMERDYDYSAAIHPKDLKSPEEIGMEAGRRAARRVNPRKLKSEALPVIFENRVAGGLIGHLASAINGQAIARGSSFLAKNLHEMIFSKEINIIDDPLRMRGLGSKPFDGEGLPTRRRGLVENGVLSSWIMDLRSARQLGLASTASASRGLASPPAPASSNLTLQPGAISKGDLLKSINRGLYVTELLGMGVNVVTGEYSRGASGFWIENGEVLYPVSEITIAGNLRDMFKSLIPGDDLEFRSATNAPTCRIEGLTIAGQ
jgi:PmbA protein